MDHAAITVVRRRPGAAEGERAFRPQLGSRGSPTDHGRGQSFLRAVSVLVAKGGGRRKGASARGVRGGGTVGGAGTAGAGFQAKQRVVVKARVVRNRRRNGRGTVQDHVDYLERDGVDRDGEKGRSFNADDYLSADEVDAFIDRTSGDRHHFRFIISPEHAAGLDLQSYTRELMMRAEIDLGTSLDWMAVAHFNTDNPHVHVVIRGRDDEGRDLRIGRDYISRGMRERAQELATRELGPRAQTEIDAERAANLKAERPTRLDRELAAEASLSEGIVDVRPAANERSYAERVRLEKITRLNFLETLDLVREERPGRWRVPSSLDALLKDRQRQIELTEQLGRAAGERIAFRDIRVYDQSKPEDPRIEGVVVGRARVDELDVTDQLFVAAQSGPTHGTVYRLAASERADRWPGFVRPGQVVQLSVHERAAWTRTDERILEQATRDGGNYSAERHRQWVEAELHGARAGVHIDVDEFIERHVQRIQGHERRAHVEPIEPGVWKVPQDFKSRLDAYGRSRGDRDKISVVEPVSNFTLEEQIKARGATWLDQHLARGAHLALDGVTPPYSADRAVRSALLARAEELEGRGIGVRNSVLRGADIERLYREELEVRGRELEAKFGHYLRPEELPVTGLQHERRVEGKFERMENLTSGQHALIINRKGFALVPAARSHVRYVGQEVSISMRAAEPTAADRPAAVQQRVSFRSLERELEREREQGRTR